MRNALLLGALFIARPAWAAESGSLLVVGGGLAVVVLACAVLLFVSRRHGLLATALGGVGSSLYLTVQHHVAQAGGSSICNINSSINCDVVNTSAWSEVAGIPVALFGLGYFAAMAWAAWRRVQGAGNPTALVAGSALGVAVSAFMAFQSAQLGAWCLFCASLYAATLLLLVGSILENQKEKSGGGFFEEVGPAVAMGLSAFIVGILVYQNQASAGPAAAAGGDSLAGLYERPRGKIVVDGTEPVEGSASARYTLVEWADYECPHCAKMAPELAKVVKENPDVKLLFKHYPISGDCNRFVEGQRHQYSCRAAAAAECARVQGKFTELSHAMFANQQYLADDDIKFMAREKGLDLEQLAACWELPTTLQSVRDDVEAGGTAMIDGTPSVFLHGLFGDEWVRVNGGYQEISAILAAARAGKPLPPPGPPSE